MDKTSTAKICHLSWQDQKQIRWQLPFAVANCKGWERQVKQINDI